MHIIGSRVHPLDDVAVNANLPQCTLSVLTQDPLTAADGLGKAKPIQISKPRDLLHQIGVGLLVDRWRHRDDAVWTGIGCKLAIETSPEIRLEPRVGQRHLEGGIASPPRISSRAIGPHAEGPLSRSARTKSF